MFKNKIAYILFALVTLSIFSGCTKEGNINKIESINEDNVVLNQEVTKEKITDDLKISFIDLSWDGLKVPENQHCKMFEGNGSSPELLIENIPTGTKFITISYNDRTFAANDNGGHGIVGIGVNENETSLTVPTFPGESLDLPENMFVVENFRSTRGQGGVYLPPCSGGAGNEYYISFQALDSEINEAKDYTVLAEGSIEMGIY